MELAALYAKLADAEEKLAAIQQGAVDALVIQGPDGPKVYTLQSADHPYRLLVEQMNEAALTLSRDARILYCNRRFGELVARSEAEIVGSALVDFVVASDRAHVQASLQEASVRAVRMNFGLEAHRMNAIVPVQASFSPLATDGFEGSVAVLTDLTELYRNKAIAESERVKKMILDQASDAIVLCDRAGQVIWGNRTALGWFGPDVAGKPWDRLCGDSALSGCAERGEEVRSLPVSCASEHRGDRELFVTAKRIDPMDRGEFGWVVTFTDITAVRRVELELRRADQRKDRFLAMLAHELRNPLASIRHAAAIQNLVAPREARLDQTREVIERQVEHLARLIDDLLDVSRITQGKINLERRPVALESVLTGALDVVRPFIEARRQRLAAPALERKLFIKGDLTRLVQALGNLLSNASKFSDIGAAIALGVEEEGDDVLLRVVDSGVGIAPEFLPHVFELFTQGNQTLDRPQGGLGIGLALVRQLIEMHGGRVDATSGGIGQGTEFVVRLPRLESAEEEAAPADPPGAPSESRRILVVDDNADAADSLATLLRLEGHEVQIANDGLGALTLARSMRPQVVLLDIGLPGMDGYEVARRLRQCPEARNSTLIAMTGYGQEQDRRRSKQAGFAHHLVKPVAFDTLSRVIAE